VDEYPLNWALADGTCPFSAPREGTTFDTRERKREKERERERELRSKD
jgi:hypothetical protein